MAWLNDRWLNRDEREQLIAKYQSFIDDCKAKGIDKLPVNLRVELAKVAGELKRLKRIHRGEVDLLYFAYEYFGDHYNPDNAGNWIPVTIDKAPEFHREICAIMDDVSNVRLNAKVAVAAPRSHAKSSFLSRAFVLREVVYRKRKYIINISETPAVATANLEWLALQLKSNQKLREDFGPLLSPRQQENPKDNSTEFVAWEPNGDNKRMIAKVEAASTGQALRGKNWNGQRPDAIIADDLESKKNTNTEQLREELKNWWQSVVMPLGDPTGKKTAYIVMGTTVHESSLLMDIIHRRSDFESKVYRAVISFPTNEHLWEECRKIYVNFDNPNRAQDAEAFYLANKDAMDEGAQVLWPEVQPLFKLMTWKWDNSSKAFYTEYQNEPIDVESMLFNPDKFTYWDDTEPDKQFTHSDYYITLSVDFALGKQRGDYSAISVVAKDKKSGIYYVVDSFIQRVKPDEFMQVIVEKTLQWQPDAIAAEAVAAQEFFVQKLKEALRYSGYPAHNRVKEIYSKTRKELRIESMLPDIESGKIRFCRKHYLLLEQFMRYGTNAADDGPDSLHMAISIASRPRIKLLEKPAFL